MSDLMKDLPRAGRSDWRNLRAPPLKQEEVSRKVGRFWPHSAGAVAAGWISIYCRDFRSSLINSVVSIQFLACACSQFPEVWIVFCRRRPTTWRLCRCLWRVELARMIYSKSRGSASCILAKISIQAFGADSILVSPQTSGFEFQLCQRHINTYAS